MKKLLVASLVWLLLAAPTAWCTDPFVRPDIDTGLLPGTWSCSLGGVTNLVTFKGDQTFFGELRQNGKVIDRYEGTWQAKMPYLSAPELVWEYSKSSRLSPGRIDRDTLEILNSKLLVIWSQAKERHAYHRVASAPQTKVP